MPSDVVIVSATRTPIATAYKGSLGGVDAFTLAELAIGAAIERSGIPISEIQDMGIGESYQGGGNIGRNVAVRLGMNQVPAVATQRWCASAMAGTQWIAANIAAGMIDVGVG
ncbi:MAG: acetyl-CoA C-acyltransferase, partial [Microthrixaceae bacterium]|nr:acetyl-CoA C-acyltransferase [Microthrixaceae bacterium]